MVKKSFYVSPLIEWESPLDEAGVLCQSPQSGELGDIVVGDDDGSDWF